MVALRGGKKAKATAASRKAVEKEKAAAKQRAAAEAQAALAESAAAAAATATNDAADADGSAEMTHDERARKLVAFLTYAGLALHAPEKDESESATSAAAAPPAPAEVTLLHGIVERMGVAPFLDAMLVAQCATGKDRAAVPQEILSRLTSASRKRVCGVIFKADEIAYSCRNCQVDSTCVICKDCFMLGDHSGHDVYFQRTTAGSSCDCGDLHAWKRSGFCSRHPGAEEDQDSKKSKKSSLPKGLSTMAAAIIDTVVDFVYQVYLGIDHGFEFAEALEVFSRGIPPMVLTELTTASNSKPQSVSSPSTTTTSAPVESRRRSRGNRRSVSAVDPVVMTTASSLPSSQQLAIRLHNDDVHSLREVTKEICTALDCRTLQARECVGNAERQGDSTVATKYLVECIAPVSSLVRSSINISVAPVWWEKQMSRIPMILEWLRTIGMASDGLYDIVSESLRKRRTRRLGAPTSISSYFKTGTSSASLWRDNRVRLHPSVQALIDEATLGDEGDVHTWAEALEGIFDEMYRFSDKDDIVSALPLQERCDNVLILSLMKSVSLSEAYGRHQSIRDGCIAVSKRFFATDDRAPASLLGVMVRWDCALRKRVAHLGHALLREHMLNKVFRKCMLESYATSYCAMTHSYLKGLGTSPDSIFDFAVQFLTVPQLVKDYTRSEVEKDPSKPHLAYELLFATTEVLNTAVQKSSNSVEGDILNVDHPSLSSQKYKHCIDDLEYVFNVGAMPNELVCDDRNLALWISCLKVLQNGDLQARRGIRESHVEYESDSWLSMFNLGIRIHSIFPVSWKGMTAEALTNPKRTVRHISRQVIDSVIKSSIAFNQKIRTKKLASIKTLHGTAVEAECEVYDFNVSASKTSLHIPLHRFLASSIRHVSIHESWLRDALEADGLLSAFALDQLSFEKKVELVELPLRCLVMASQIQSNLWRRNGEENMMAQLYNYSALPYCVHYRDADVFLLQVGILLLGPDMLLSLMIDRFQLGDFFMAKDMGYTSQEEGVDEQQELQMVEEFLRLVIVLGTSLPSAVGAEYENQFMEEEMLQHLCAKPASFSKLFDIAMLPTGQDDISVPRLEEVLARVADFSPPSGLDPGRYELKDGLLEEYNPYFLHLNREAHELARDRWTNYRKSQRQKHRASSSTPLTIAPLKRMRRPLQFLRKARGVLTCQGTITMVHVILWKIAGDMKGGAAGSSVSDAVISTTLHLLVYGVYAAEELHDENDNLGDAAAFWRSLSSTVETLGNSSVLSLLYSLGRDGQSTSSILDDDQVTTLAWLLSKMRECSVACAAALDSLEESKHVSNLAAGRNADGLSGGSADSSNQQAVTMEQRKDEARKRALEAMARQQAAFQAMMAEMGDEEGEDEDMETDEDSGTRAVDDSGSSTLGKRRASVEDASADADESKRPRLSDEANEADGTCFKCILCHDTSTQGEMGMAAYVHQSTVLTGSFRPEPEEGLVARGAEVRKQVKTLIEKMDLCSGGPTVSSNSPSPALRALAAQFPEWYMDDGFDEELMLDPPMPHLNAVGNQRQIRHNNVTDGDQTARNQRRRPPIEAFLMNQDEEDLEMLEGVLDLQDDQRLFPLPILGGTGVSPDRRDRGVQRPPGADRGIIVARRGAPLPVESDLDDDDSDEFDEDDHHVHHHHHHHNQHHHHSHHHNSPRRPRSNSRIESVPLHLTPCGLHIRTCQHAVHIHCLERYIRSLHEKAIRGEDFDGVQAIDPDAAMTQFLCPLCKTLCNFLIPTSDPGGNSQRLAIAAGDADVSGGPSKPWYNIVDRQLKAPGWYRAVLGRDGDFGDDEDDAHDVWRDYFEETLWEPHGSLEKGAPYLWSACAFSVASFLNAAEDDFRKASGTDEFDPITTACPPVVEKEFTSLIAVTKFCRWSFSLLEHSEDAKVIWETAKRCNPINTETQRECRKFNKVLSSIDACLRGTILGLLVADTFTAFVISSVIADSPSTIWNFIPVFSAADLLQRVYTEFFVQSKTDERSLLQDKFAFVEGLADVDSSEGSLEEGSVRRTRRSSRLAILPNSKKPAMASEDTKSIPSGSKPPSAEDVIRAMQDNEANKDSEEYAVLTVLARILDSDSDRKLKSLTKTDMAARLRRIKTYNGLLVRRMKLFWRCLADETRDHGHDPSSLVIPCIADVASSPKPVFTQIWNWCVGRMTSKNSLGSEKSGDKCEHAEGCGEGYIASMFILRDTPRKPRLIDLPLQYDELYGMLSGRKCTRCEKTPCDPGICLVCGEFLCCGDSCCSHPYVNHGPQVGECTRHAAECGGGIGIVLMLDQCRVAVIGGSMAAHFPCPYVDAHGEEDVGLQRGRPLRLDTTRYKLLESLWLNHRIFSEVSRLRNMRDPQFTINLSLL